MKSKIVSILILILVFAIVITDIVIFKKSKNEPKIIFAGFENGCSVSVATTKNGEVVLFDCGDKYSFEEICNLLSSNKIYHVDYVFLSSKKDEHKENLKNLAKMYDIKEVFVANKDFSDSTLRENNVKVTFLEDYKKVDFSPLKIECISTQNEEKNTVFKVIYNDFSCILSGGITNEEQIFLFNNYPDFFLNVSLFALPHTYKENNIEKEQISAISPKKILCFAKSDIFPKENSNTIFAINTAYTQKFDILHSFK